MLPTEPPVTFVALSLTRTLKWRTSWTSWPVLLVYGLGKLATIVFAGDSVTETPPVGSGVPSSVHAVAQRLPGTRVWREPSASVTFGVPYIVVFFGIVVVTV